MTQVTEEEDMAFEDEQGPEQSIEVEADVELDATFEELVVDDDDVVEAHTWRAQS